jgi:hypothetical protein
MKILTAIRKILQDDSGVAGLATGGVHIIEVAQNSRRPNVMLMQISGNDDVMHDGADGLHQDAIRIYCRGDTVEQASLLSDAVAAVLHTYVSPAAVYGVTIQLAHKVNSNGDFQDDAKVFRQIEDYRVHYRVA